MDVLDDGTWMPCLGRNLELGTLYDCCTDDTIVGSSIWDGITICKAQEEKIVESNSIECTVYTPNNIAEKASCLGIKDELYLSCASGHINLQGEGKFFNDEKPSKRCVCVALKCFSSSKIVELNKIKLQFSNIDTFEQGNATHIITAIKYGAISIIVLYQKIPDVYSMKTTYELLRTKVEYLQRCISENFPKELDTETTESITCKFYTTLQIEQSIKTYPDAVKFCNDLYKLHMDCSTHKPIDVFLIPLTKLDKKFTKHTKNIDDNGFIAKVKCMRDTLIDISLDIEDLKASKNTIMLPCITEQIEFYSKSISGLQSEFNQTLGKIIPRFKIEESSVQQKIEGFYNRCESLHNSIQLKLKEVQQLGNFMKVLKDYTLISSISEVDISYEYIICLEFNSAHFIDYQQPANKSTWYLDKKKIAEARHKIRQFLKFAKDNSNEGIKFAICEFSDKECNELVVIRLHHNKEILAFEPPTPPGKPVESQKTESSIALNWSEPQHGSKFIDFCHVYMCKVDDEKWTPCPNIKYANQMATIESLQPNTKYLFKVHATTKIQTVIESQVSEVICTADYELPPPKPGKKKKAPSKPTKLDDEAMLVKSKPSKAHNCSKVAKTALNQK